MSLLSKNCSWEVSNKMKGFEREWLYDELVELYRDKKDGKVKIPS